jgi:hypothetical protein
MKRHLNTTLKDMKSPLYTLIWFSLIASGFIVLYTPLTDWGMLLICLGVCIKVIIKFLTRERKDITGTILGSIGVLTLTGILIIQLFNMFYK